MPTDWKPNAPDLKKEFNREQAPPERAPVSKRQIEALESERGKPVIAPQLTPGGTVQNAVDRQVAASRELRIATLKRRLERVRGRASHDFSRAR